MDQVVGIRPFVPAKEFATSVAFYQALGFSATYQDSKIAVLDLGGFCFILQNFYVAELAANCMVQLAVRDVAAFWGSLPLAKVTARFNVKQPIPPSVQPWGLTVGYIFDPCGVLWHVAGMPA